MSSVKNSSTFDFDAVADEYDRWYEQPVGQMYDRLEKNAISKVLGARAGGKRLLEVGCGTGHWSDFFAGAGFDVIGIDASKNMIRNACKKGIGSARFAAADAHSLPFAAASFDLACAITSLEFFADPTAALLEMARCVKPGGRLVVGVLNHISLLAWLRRRRGSNLFAKARMMSPKEVVELLRTAGEARAHSTAFVLPWPGLLWLSPFLDAAGRLLHLPFGDFIVGTAII